MSTTWKPPVTGWQPADYFNAADLTRIEGNIEWLSEYLKSHGYDVQAYPHREWDITEIPNTADLERICAKIAEIADKYYEPEGFWNRAISEISDKPLDNRGVNYLERCLRLIKEMIESGKTYNSHQALGRFTHAELAAFQHWVLRSGKIYNAHRALGGFTHAQIAAFRHEPLRKDGSIVKGG